MYTLDLEKTEKSEIKLLTSIGSQKKQENSRNNIYFCFTDYTKAFDFFEEEEMTEDEMAEWHHQLNGCLIKLQEMVKDREVWCVAVHEVGKSWI